MGSVGKLLSIVFIVFIAETHGNLICYQCNSYSDSNGTYCRDLMNLDTKRSDCGSNHVCTKVTYYNDSTYVVSRSCHRVMATNNETCDRIGRHLSDRFPNHISQFLCMACNNDLCNSTIHVETTWGLITMGILSLLLHKSLK